MKERMPSTHLLRLAILFYSGEMDRRKKFYAKHPESTAKGRLDAGHISNETYISSDDIIHLSLQYFSKNSTVKV